MSGPIVLTGCGLVTASGHDLETTWAGLARSAPAVTRIELPAGEGFPYRRGYSIAELDATPWIRKPGDRRAMGRAMTYGAVAAGMALASAKLLGDEERLERTALHAAARFDERDWEMDESVARDLADETDWQGLLNARLLERMRPSLFLAQLPNLYAGNICLIHQVTGSSITFMGEHSAGAVALLEGMAALRSGRADVVVAGGSFNADCLLARLAFASSGWLSPDDGPADARPVRSWAPGSDGTLFGSCGAYVVIERAEDARRRGAEILAELVHVGVSTRRREPGSVAGSLRRRLAAGPRAGGFDVVVGHGSGVPRLDAEELEFLGTLAPPEGRPTWVTSATPALGNPMEPSLIVSTVLAALALERGRAFPLAAGADAPDPAPGVRIARDEVEGAFDSALALALGLDRGECVSVVQRYGKAA